MLIKLNDESIKMKINTRKLLQYKKITNLNFIFSSLSETIKMINELSKLPYEVLYKECINILRLLKQKFSLNLDKKMVLVDL